MLDVIDAHHHLTALGRASYPWLEGEPVARYHGDDLPLRRDYLVADYRADAAELEQWDARLVGSVHVENGAADPAWEAEWIDSVIAESAVPTAQVAKVDLTVPDAAGLVAARAALASVRGIRDILNWHPDPLYTHRDRGDVFDDPAWRRGFAALAEHGLSFDLQVFPDQLPRAAAHAAEFGGTTIILDHAAMPIDRTPDGLRSWRRGMERVVAEPNTVVKISALGTNDHRWTVDSIRRIVLDSIDIFGPERCMFASNFPVDGLYSTMGELYAAFFAIVEDFSDADRREMFAGTAARVYRLDAG